MTSGSYGRIRRGQMAADRFTQISNDLFRDPRIGFKAKGIFGLIATHRDGYGITPKRLAEQSTDGLDAVKSGLRELESCGYLMRSQERRLDGTLGPVEYWITDTPEGEKPSSPPVVENPPPVPTSTNRQNRRSEPVVDYPPAVHPPTADPTPKNTKSKNTRGKNTNPTSPLSSPAARGAGAFATGAGRSGGSQEAGMTRGSEPQPGTPGQDLLWMIADIVPGLVLPGSAVRRLGAQVDALLGRGWSRGRLLTALTADTDTLTHPRGALAWRINDLLETPVPGHAPTSPAVPAPDRGVLRECPGDDGLCGRPLRAGEALCGLCCAQEVDRVQEAGQSVRPTDLEGAVFAWSRGLADVPVGVSAGDGGDG